MKKWWRILLIVGILAGSLLAVSCQPWRAQDALIQGAVTIGPISPVERPGENPPVPPEAFSSRYIIIYDESGKHPVREIYFTQIGHGATGYYATRIAPGTYVVDINHLGMDRAANLPLEITVIRDEAVTIDVHIDTGIR